MKGPSKTTIVIAPEVRAAYEAMRVECPGLSLTDFYHMAAKFFIQYHDEASLQPLVKHLSTLTRQLDTLSQQLKTVVHPPVVNHDHLAHLVTKSVVDELTKVPPPVVIPGVRGWLIRRWQKRYGDIAHSPGNPRRYVGPR